LTPCYPTPPTANGAAAIAVWALHEAAPPVALRAFVYSIPR